jgi:prepilin-type N-terminal cleavage/methylation domain-containing protein
MSWKLKSYKNKKGFTLVEIAIVLVIITRRLGGVLKGQELIQNSKVKSVIADFNNVEAAYWAYRDRTGHYPAKTNSGFWYNLRDEGFISGELLTSTTAVGPTHALDGVFSFVEAASGNLIENKSMLCASGIEDTIATNMDTKVDDILGTTGSMRGIVEGTPGTAVVTGTAMIYGTTGTSFTVCKELQ